MSDKGTIFSSIWYLLDSSPELSLQGEYEILGRNFYEATVDILIILYSTDAH